MNQDLFRKKPRHYVCDYCGAVNNFTLTNHRDEEPIYTYTLEFPTHYYFRGQYTKVICNKCGSAMDPDYEDTPPLKRHGVYQY